MTRFNFATVSVVALCAFGGAIAGEAGESSRADVIADMHAARASGLLDALHGEDSGSFHLSRQAAPTALTRDAVRAQLAAARASGDFAELHSEDSGSDYLTRHMAPSTLTRAQVRAEMLAARTSGELQAMTSEDSGSAYIASVQATQRAVVLAAR
jgi:hypothetical protein